MIPWPGGDRSRRAAASDPARDGDSLLAEVGLVAVLLIGLAGVVCWCGAQLSAVVFGHGAMSANVAQGGPALVTLTHHWSEPSAAWPPDARATLPGPIAYWTCTLAVMLAFALGVGGLAWWWRRSHASAGGALGVRTNAGFASGADLRRLTVPAPQPGRLTLGYAGRRLLAAEPRVSLAVVGPTGCGKTVGFAIPALLEWRGPVIATSVKADLVDASVEHRRARGQVWIYDPTSSSGHTPNAWSPLDACRTWSGAMRVSAWLCDAAQARTDSVNDYWYTHARKALAPYLYAAALEHRTMSDVVHWIDGEESAEVEAILRHHAGFDDAIDRLLASEYAAGRREAMRGEVTETQTALMREQLATTAESTSGSWEQQSTALWPVDNQTALDHCIEQTLDTRLTAELHAQVTAERQANGELDPLLTAQSLWRKEPRLRGSVFATIENVLVGYADPGVGLTGDGCDIDFDAWLAGDNTIYVVAPSHEQARLRSVLTVFVQQAIRSAYDHANAQGGSLAHPCLVLLDEAGNIAPLHDLPGYASTARSHGITLVSIWQDLAQIKAVYGTRAQTVLNNHGAKLFGTGIADDTTLEYVSRLIGDERRTEINVSRDLRSSRRSLSEHTNYRRAAPMDVIRRIRPNEAVLLYGSELPAHVRLRPWFERGSRRSSRRPRRGRLVPSLT